MLSFSSPESFWVFRVLPAVGAQALTRAWFYECRLGKAQGEAGGAGQHVGVLCNGPAERRTGGRGHARRRQHLRLQVERFQARSFEVWP